MQKILIILGLLSSVPVGIYLSRITSDELMQGRKWFKAIMACSLFLAFLLILFSEIFKINTSLELSAVFALVYLFSISSISFYFSSKKHHRKI